MMEPLWKTFWQFLKKLNIELPYNPAIPLQGIYARELKTCLHKNLYTALIIIAKHRMNPNIYQLVSRLKMWNIHATAY